MAQQPPPTGDGAPVSDPSPNPADSATPAAAAAATSTAATSAAVAPPAATVTGPTAAAAPPGSLDSDWAAQVVGSLDHYIALVHDRTTKPAVVVARAVVFGLIIAILGVAADRPALDRLDHGDHGPGQAGLDHVPDHGWNLRAGRRVPHGQAPATRDRALNGRPAT